MVDEPEGKFDYLMIDAFSSDSIPVHLLTREAIDLYFSRLNETGMLVFHLSNRYMELPSIVGAFAKEKGFIARLADKKDISKADKENYISGSIVVVVARKSADLGGLIGDSEWTEIRESGATIWTDEYSNVLAAIWRKRNESAK
ncbi:MAG: hypothetical protein U5K75_10570 [Ahrensia sp.]|nr:hypothetical protein [Ahrensia sp.]